jgi:F-type H+-transporting ATPase subunit delta
VSNNLVAQRYARAVIDNVDADKHLVLNEDINCLKEAFLEDREYASAMNSFLYPLKERLQLAEKITEKLNIKNVWSSLFQILIKKHRFDIIMDLLISLEHYLLVERKRIKATITLAFEHEEDVVLKIRKIVEKVLESKIEISLLIDPSIIGGFVAETESMRIDGSIKNNLVKLVQTSIKRKE